MTSLALACKLGTAAAISQLPTRVKRILRKYGATLLMPGAAEPILGPELVTNGDFSNGTTGWLEALGSGASISVASGSLRLTAGSAGARACQSFPTVAGRLYRLSITKSGGTATQSGYRITSDATGGATGQIASETAISGDWSRSIVFTATESNTTIAPLTAQSTGTADFDNISVREVLGYQNTYSSFVAGNYKESTGNTLAAVDQQVGLVVDAAQSPEPELVTNGDFSNGITGWASGNGSILSAVGGVLSITSTGTYGAKATSSNFTTVAGKSYLLTVNFINTTGVPATLRAATSTGTGLITDVSLTATGKYQAVFVATTSLSQVIVYLPSITAGYTASFDNISVRELPGIHASQATSGYQSYMRQVPKTLGPELVSNGAFDAADGWSMGAGWGISGGTLNHHAPSTLTSVLAVATQVGKTYQCSYSITSQSAAGSGVSLRVGSTNLTIRNGVGTYSETLTQAVDSATVGFIARGGSGDWLGSIDNLSVREVLEWTYAWQLDGVDDRMSFSAVPFGTSDDFVMISGCRPAAALDMTIIGLGNSGQTNPAIVLGTLPSGQPRMWARNDAGTFVQVQGPSSVVGSDVVLTGRKKGSVMELRVNGVAAPTAAWPANSMAINTATLGALTRTTVGGFFSGHMHPQIMINGAPSDAEIGVLERFIARWQGRNI